MAGMSRARIVFLPQQPWQRQDKDRRGCGEEGGGHGNGEPSVGSEPGWGGGGRGLSA